MSDNKDQLVDFSKEVAVAVKEAGSITQVVSFEEAEEASVAYASAKKRLKALEETRKSLLAPLKKAVTDLDSTLKANLAPLEAEVERLNSIVLAFHAAERKKAIDAQAAADAAAGGHHDERRQVLVLRAQAVNQPRSHAWPRERLLAGAHLQRRTGMVDVVRAHRADDADVVNA